LTLFFFLTLYLSRKLIKTFLIFLKELTEFFDQLTSYHVVMDLLYEKKRYDDVIKLYNVLTERPFFVGRFPKECLVLVVASLHKIVRKLSHHLAI
jgi:hypothetical protein